MSRILVCLIFFWAALAAGSLYAQPVRICVSIPPQKTFAAAVGKDLVQVDVMVRPGANPATYEPRPSQLAALAQTDIYFAVGVPFERAWLERFAAVNPQMRIVHTEKDIEKKPLPSSYNLKTQEPVSGQGHQGIKDPHVWLSPPLVRIQAQNMGRALQEIDPSHEAMYQKHLFAFLDKVNSLHADLQDLLAPVQGKAFLVFHPAWGYFARTYGLRQVAVELEGKDPKPSQLGRLISFARDQNIRAIFVQPQFSAKSARVVARDIGAEVIVADPLAEDWSAQMRRHAQDLRRVIRD